MMTAPGSLWLRRCPVDLAHLPLPPVQGYLPRLPTLLPAGNHYIKCPSPAWMHEWIAIECLRHT